MAYLKLASACCLNNISGALSAWAAVTSAMRDLPVGVRKVSIMCRSQGRRLDPGWRDGRPFCDRVADQAMFEAIKAIVKAGIEVVEMDCNINDAAFASKAVEMMLAPIEKAGKRAKKQVRR